MMILCALLGIAVMCAGCQTILPVDGNQASQAKADELWAAGQAALRRGQPDAAITYYEQSLSTDPSFTENHLSLAAAHLERGDEASACQHLQQYVAVHPKQLRVRMHLAELLFRAKRAEDAEHEFEQCDASAQEFGKSVHAQRIRFHSRLTKLAQARNDRYATHLHRGIGLYLLARERAELPDPEGNVSMEGLLIQSAGELAEARMLRPEEARPCWYLYEVWSELGQRQPAQRWLNKASATAPFSYLTAIEHRDLQLACETREVTRLGK